jgi:hypothetical protein
VLALLADGPLADREIEIAEPRPTIEMAQDVDGREVNRAAPVHRYRLAGVELVPLSGTTRRFDRIAVYVHAPHAPSRVLAPDAAARAA